MTSMATCILDGRKITCNITITKNLARKWPFMESYVGMESKWFQHLWYPSGFVFRLGFVPFPQPQFACAMCI